MDLYYRKLFSIRFEHGYYREGKPVKDFRVIPTSETASKLGLGSFHYKTQDDGLLVGYRATLVGGLVTPSLPATDIANGEMYSFRLDLLNSLFFNFTDLDAVIAGNSLRNRIFYYSSVGGAETPGGGGTFVAKVTVNPPEFLRAFGKMFTYDFSHAGNPPLVDLVVKDRNGIIVANGSSPLKGEDTYATYLDLSAFPEGPFTIERWVGGVYSGQSEKIYLLGGPGNNLPFGILEIPKSVLWEQLQTRNETPANNDVIQYTIAFSERQVVWRYRVVFSMSTYSTIPGDYSLEDELLTLLPDRYNTTLAGDKFFFGLETVTTYEGKPALLFHSVDNLGVEKEYRLLEEAKHDLNFKKGTIKVRGPLPNPDISTLKPEVILFV